MAWEQVERITVTFLASKDIKQFHIDLNVTEFLIGRSNMLGVDNNQQVNLAFSHAIYRGPEFTGKVYGEPPRPDDARVRFIAAGR